jgi:hypothetical protein
MLKRIAGTALVLSITSVTAQSQTALKPEDGFLSTSKYTNAFFGFSLPLPDVNLQSLSQNGAVRVPFRHTLFRANSIQKGYPVIALFADEITGSRPKPTEAILGFGSHNLDVVQISGQEFSRGKWRAEGIYRVAYATAMKGYVLSIYALSFDRKVLDQFEQNIQQLHFFDAGNAQQEAGPDSYSYQGPSIPSTTDGGNKNLKPNPETSSQQAPTSPKTGYVADASPGLFYDATLDLHFNYPVEMRKLDAEADIEIGHRNIFGMPGYTDPEHQEAKRCMKIFFDADLPKENAPQRNADVGYLWVDDSKAYKESRKAEPIYAKILLFELVQDCVPKKLRKKEDDVLGSMALGAVAAPWIGRMPKPLWYEIGKQKIHMNSGVGRPIVNGQLASAPIIIMSMATQWHDHLLEWVFTSNDAEIFNEMTKSLVQFGDGPWGPMFLANIGPNGSGTPITVLPK